MVSQQAHDSVDIVPNLYTDNDDQPLSDVEKSSIEVPPLIEHPALNIGQGQTSETHLAVPMRTTQARRSSAKGNTAVGKSAETTPRKNTSIRLSASFRRT